MNVLVTGAGGFSGAEITMALLARGHCVTAAVGSARGRLPDSADHVGRLEVIAGDLAGDLRLPKKLHAIVHAAARSPAPGISDEDLMRANVVATRRLVQHSKQIGIERFIFLSSLSIYGRIVSAMVDEATPLVDPDTYGRSKRICEEMLSAEADRFCSLAIRLPGILGRNSVRNWLTGVLGKAREGREIVIYNPNAAFNNAVHVSDLARFTADLLEFEWRGFDAVTVGAAGQITVLAAVRLLVDSVRSSSQIRVGSSPNSSFLISNARASGRYGYRPMEITEMLRRFAAENTSRQP